MLNSPHHYWKQWIIPKSRQAKVFIPPSLSALLVFNRNPFITIFEFSFLTWYTYSSCSVCIFSIYLQQCLSDHVRILWLTTTSWMNPFFSSVEENLIFFDKLLFWSICYFFILYLQVGYLGIAPNLLGLESLYLQFSPV